MHDAQRRPANPAATANTPAPAPNATFAAAPLDDVLAGAALVDVAPLLPDEAVDAALALDADPDAAVLIVLMTLAVLIWLAILELTAAELLDGAAVVLGAAVEDGGADVLGAAVELGAGDEEARTLERMLKGGV